MEEAHIIIFNLEVPQAAICLLQGLADSYDGIFALRTADAEFVPQDTGNKVLECYVDPSQEDLARKIIASILEDCDSLIKDLR